MTDLFYLLFFFGGGGVNCWVNYPFKSTQKHRNLKYIIDPLKPMEIGST